MEQSHKKPKMVFFMPSMDNYPPTQLGFIFHQMVAGLSEFFELVIVSKDCDYAEVCDTHQPDITMFDSGHEMLPCRVRVTNTSAFPSIPKTGYVRSDAFSHNRTVFLSDMDQWGVETFFTCDTAMAEYTPEIADQLFYWPHFINTDVFRDYGQDKAIHVLFVGNCDGPALEYHWRIKVKERVTKVIPSLIVPHPGYNKESPAVRVYGEEYARLINSSLVVPTCGAMSKVVVMKHLEIPAARACLVTEQTPAVEAFGFVDSVNCVFADESNVVDKLKYLFAHRDELERITEAGYQLAHTRHTVKQRPQILQWLRLRQSLKAGQRIVQPELLGDLKIVGEAEDVKDCRIINNTIDRQLIRQGDEKLAEGKVGEAKLLYRKCFEYIEWMPEPKLRLAICGLHEGDTNEALDWISQLLETSLGKYEANTPDPAEFSWFLISLLSCGKVEDASKFSDYYPELRHPELDRARWAVWVLSGRKTEATVMAGQSLAPITQEHRRKSIHKFPQLTFDEYLQKISNALRACSQRALARELSTAGADYSRMFSDNEKLKGAYRSEGDDPPLVVAANYDVEELLEYLSRIRSSRRPKLSAKLKSRAPTIANAVNNLLTRHPTLKAKVRTFAMSYLKIQDW